jgi:hypothetical protein
MGFPKRYVQWVRTLMLVLPLAQSAEQGILVPQPKSQYVPPAPSPLLDQLSAPLALKGRTLTEVQASARSVKPVPFVREVLSISVGVGTGPLSKHQAVPSAERGTPAPLQQNPSVPMAVTLQRGQLAALLARQGPPVKEE